jgi:hypothetical protein
VEEVLVDGGELVEEDLVEVLEDFLVAFHRASVEPNLPFDDRGRCSVKIA